MTQLTTELETIGRDLCLAYSGRLRRRRRIRAGAAATCSVLIFAGAAYASGIADDLHLDPTKWEILGGGSIDGGKGEFVHAKSLQDGGPSTFMVEHDAGMDRYGAFLLHERLKAAADESSPTPAAPEPGALCTRAELTRIERNALDALRANGSPEAATAAETCRGRAYGIEMAQRVFSGLEPATNLMPGVQ
ncbi:MAG: hypothetical protein H0W87_07770 [Actinobacteria bacterium]|nr:hypothetical protein [Actinomycetota bacterium]